MLRLGIDVGGSTTKLAAADENGNIVGTLQVRAADQVTSLYGALGRFLKEESLSLCLVKEIYLTGVGASFFNSDIYGITTRKVDEFSAIGRGALQLTGLSKVVAVSVGTGTAFVRVTNSGAARIGGSGVGGGTLLGLSHLLLQEEDIDRIAELSRGGDAANVDLLVGAISAAEIPLLPKIATAANFGNVNPTTRREDIALGISNLITHTVGMLSVFAVRNDPDGINDVVMVGSVANLPQFHDVLDAISEMTGVRFHIPPRATFATAMGAISVDL